MTSKIAMKKDAFNVEGYKRLCIKNSSFILFVASKLDVEFFIFSKIRKFNIGESSEDSRKELISSSMLYKALRVPSIIPNNKRDAKTISSDNIK